MRVFGLFLGILAAFCLCACSRTAVTALNDGANSVKIAPSAPQNCQNLGEIEGYKRSGGSLNLQEIINSAKNDLKNKAHALGANTIVIVFADGLSANEGYYTGFYGRPFGTGYYVPYTYPREYLIQAVAYRCE